MMNLAYFRLPNGQGWIGEGPFAEAAEPPDGAAFYVNDFALSDAKPWKIPARLVPVNGADDLNGYFVGTAAPTIAWEMPETEWFKMAFRRIRRDVLAQKVRKMVPVLTEHGTLLSGEMQSLLQKVREASSGLWSYAWLHEDSGFLGATPELLVRVLGQSLETMALAGTAKPNGAESFVTDSKEIEEHEIVACFLDETLRPLGSITRSPREICDAAGLTHFRTSISVELKAATSLNDLVKLLHPTPAVGCLPRDGETRLKLAEYRRQLNAPAFFGAPFGFKNDGAFHCVVAIRGLGWQGNDVTLPSGCGIVGGSAFDHEWRELRIKRESVARLLGV
jgi:menaquinone-specific isochorismate synthase